MKDDFGNEYQKSRHCLTFWFELLSWSHFIELLKSDDPHERLFYEKEAENSQGKLLTMMRSGALYVDDEWRESRDGKAKCV